jgi:hypothetical protein
VIGRRVFTGTEEYGNPVMQTQMPIDEFGTEPAAAPDLAARVREARR